MPARDRYDPARDIFTSDPAPQHPPPPPPPQVAPAPVEPGPPASAPAPALIHSSPPAHPLAPVQHSQDGMKLSPLPPPLRDTQQSPSSESRKRHAASRSPPPPGSSSDSRTPVPPRRVNAGQPIPQHLLEQDTAPQRAKRRRPPSSSDNDSSHTPQRRRRDSERHREPRYRYPPPLPIIPRTPQDQDPTPPPSRQPSPPRQRKLPSAASRLNQKEKELLQKNLLQSEEAEKARLAADSAAPERVEEMVRSHYNDKKELGKEWRQTSKIKGLRSFNNWVKSTLIQKFSPSDNFDPRRPSRDPNDHLVVLDMGCGKGGDLLKWKSAPQEVGFYCGVDSADVSIAHAHDRYDSMLRDQYRGRGRGGGNRQVFQAEFYAMDCWTSSIETIPIVRRIGYDPSAGPSGRSSRFAQGGGFDVVSMMFCMHYAFETEAKCRTMLKNVTGALKSGGRFIGTIPSSDIISSRARGSDPRDKLPENEEHGVQEWGNSIYRVKFSKPPPRAGTFRPPWGWEYKFFLEEAVDQVPEYVVPWEAFRCIAEDYGLELEYKKLFHDVWREEKDQPELRQLSERMGVRLNGQFTLGDDEWEACGIYLAFAFRKG